MYLSVSGLLLSEKRGLTPMPTAGRKRRMSTLGFGFADWEPSSEPFSTFSFPLEAPLRPSCEEASPNSGEVSLGC